MICMFHIMITVTRKREHRNLFGYEFSELNTTMIYTHYSRHLETLVMYRNHLMVGIVESWVYCLQEIELISGQ